MADLEISAARLELSRQGLEGMVNGRKFQIRDKLSAAAKRNNDDGLEACITAAGGCFSVIDSAWSRLVETGTLERGSPKAAIFSSYLGADYGLWLLEETKASEKRGTLVGERDFFTNERADFSRMYPLFLEGLLATYSRALDSQSGIGLLLLTGQYLGWIRERALSEAERLPDFEREISGIKGAICGGYEFSGMMRRKPMESRLDKGEFTWENFGGYKEAVDYFRELELIIRKWNYCLSLGVLNKGELIPKGILLSGPPGTGKTRLARTFCNEAGVPFEMIGVSDVGSSFVYETSNNLQRRFDSAASYIRSGESPVSVLFIDELDSLGRAREGSPGGGREDDKAVTTIAQNMDGPKSVDGVMVIGTTNMPDAIDECLIRGKRFEKLIHMGQVTRSDAKEIFSKYLKVYPGIDICGLVERYVQDPKVECRLGRVAGEDFAWSGAMIASIVAAAKRRKLIEHLKYDCDYHLGTEDLKREIESSYLRGG